MSEVTRILTAIDAGNQKAASDLLPLVYAELRQLAAQKLSQERPGQTLQPTALVHEAFLRLVGKEDREWDSRGHFFAAAAEAMRRILVDNARRKQALRRGGDVKRRDVDMSNIVAESESADLLALDEALDKLDKKDHVKAELVKLRYFAGLTNQQAAEALGVSTATAERYWSYARAWLHEEVVATDDADDTEQ